MSGLTQENYIMLLQQRCQKNYTELPTYKDEGNSQNMFKVSCTLLGHTTEGMEVSKKMAKQLAAQLMYDKITAENLMGNENQNKSGFNPISKIHMYCAKENVDTLPVYDCKQEDKMFVVSCTFQNVTKSGRGASKQKAKEAAADEIAKHFDIHSWYETILQQKQIKTPATKLHEFLQERRLEVTSNHEKIDGKIVTYVVTLQVGETNIKSEPCFSLKLAKHNAATSMLQVLTTKYSTPSSTNGACVKSHVEEMGSSTYEHSENGDESPGVKSRKKRSLSPDSECKGEAKTKAASPNNRSPPNLRKKVK